jgi:small subunit ribosomal protein S18
MLQFQAFVRQRLAQMSPRLPAGLDVRSEAELAYLEEQVVEDHMPAHRRKLRDPLREVPLADITHTNLPLLCRFVSDGGALLPRKLTGVQAKKQRALAKAIKRAQQLALMPVVWKHPRYRQASFADAYSKPERPLPQRYEGDEFADPPDPRYPGVWDAQPIRPVDIGAMIRGGPGASPFGGEPGPNNAYAPAGRQ